MVSLLMEVTLVARLCAKWIVQIGVMLVLASISTAEDLTPTAQANPTPGCSASRAQLNANRKAVLDFFRSSGEARVALLDRSYKQHNPVAVRRAQHENLTDYEEAKKSFLEQAHGTVQGLGIGPTPPGNRFEVVTAECDIVTVVHRSFRHDPTGESKFYQAFTFDTFRVKNGKLAEHWDGASLSAPATIQSSSANPHQSLS
jgi:predicted SnoaL-like aldol condensation-catalyzing enzyme